MVKRWLLCILSVVAVSALSPIPAMARVADTPVQVVQNREDALLFDLTLPAYEITRDGDGFDVILVADFLLSGEPGEPLLPYHIYNVAVPPEVSPDSLQVEIVGGSVAKLPGTYNLRKAVPDETSAGIPADMDSVPQSSVVSSGATPADFVRLLPAGQMRKWRFARLSYSPFRFDAETGELTVANKLSVRITYATDRVLSAADAALLQDGVMDEVAAELLDNFDSAAAWYRSDSLQAEGSSGTSYDYAIITTNAIVAGSSLLDDFVIHKEERGHHVLVVTESEYGSLTGQSPNGTAEKIRQWLKNNYVGYGIEYVLLLGNPHPSTSDVPMKMCWPRYSMVSYRESPTDAFYADLTGNWDLDGDGNYGEWRQDTATGGVDFANEVYVGRIPVYNTDYAVLDSILQKTMDYENEAAPADWRKSALLPMSFGVTTYDGAPLAEQMMDDYLDYLGYDSWTQYQQGNGACGLNSSYNSDEPLRGGAVVKNRWVAHDYGLVVWWGHGSETGAYVGCDGCWDGTLFSRSDTVELDDEHPAFVFQNSCLNGYPEYSTNLQYSLLKQGAVSAVGASRVSWFNVGVVYGGFDGSTTNSGIAYEYAKRLTLYGQAAGQALANTKASITPTADTRLMNFYDFNLYGDPSTGLSSTGAVPNLRGRVVDSSGIGIAGVAVGFGGARTAVQTDGSGYYSQTGFANGTYTVTFSLDGHTFSPQLSQVTIDDDIVTLDATGYRTQVQAPLFSDGFESGILGSSWAVETDYEGRVRVDSSYPQNGSWSLLLDDSVPNVTDSHAAVILPLDLRNCSEAVLSFWWRGFGSESHPDDGVFISDNDGETWNKLYSFTANGSPESTFVSIDLVESTAMSAMSMDKHFQVKFQFYGNEPVETDGYAIDDVSTEATVEQYQVFLPLVVR